MEKLWVWLCAIYRFFASDSTPVHTFTTGDDTYDVEKLIEHSKGLEVLQVSVIRLKKHLEHECWTDDQNNPISPAALLDAFRSLGSWETVAHYYPLWESHVFRIKNADCKHPLLMCGDEVVDGMHRILCAISDGREMLGVKVFTQLPEAARYRE